MISKASPQEAAASAKKILGFYPEIPASDQQSFAAGLVETLSIYPPSVVARAGSAVHGIPGKVSFLNLAEIRKWLDQWNEEYHQDLRRRERPRALPEPARDPTVAARIERGLRELSEHLKAGFGPSTAPPSKLMHEVASERPDEPAVNGDAYSLKETY